MSKHNPTLLAIAQPSTLLHRKNTVRHKSAILALATLCSAVILPNFARAFLRPQDVVSKPVADAPAPLSEAANRITAPDGFDVSLFAGEPDVRQPIAFTIDDRGRLWVVECYSYPNWMPGAVRGQDRVVIFEDVDGDGHFDKQTVFWDKGDNLTGIELGFGGVWLCATPNLLFIPDRNSDDVPDGEPIVVLDGWDINCKHNAFTALRWGPDGWLYGCNGILSNSKVGRPGTPDSDRVPINCGVWRYHPTKQAFEVVANGTTNPWGLDFDDMGEMFITNCVIPHLFHVVPGAHFQRMYGQDFNPHLYDLMTSCADHIHWGGGDWTSSRGGQGIHSEAGGGHAHAGAMVYLGDNWPERYRNSIFMVNIHGRRVNHDSLTRSRSGYIATHAPDFLKSQDSWFRGLELKYGPDSAVYMTDWSDIGECHDYDSEDGVHRENGRIFKISYGKSRPVHPKLAELSDAELVEQQLAQNDWFVRHARRLLHERAASGRDMRPVHESLWNMFRQREEIPRKLRALWALHVTGGLDRGSLFKLLDDENENVRAWAIRLEREEKLPLDNSADQNMFGKYVHIAAEDPSPLVRLYLAAALQRIPIAQRWTIAAGLVNHAEDSQDTNLVLMMWYGIEPLVTADRATAAALAGRSKIPLIRRYLARRIVLEPDSLAGPTDPPSGLTALFREIQSASDSDAQLDLMRGIHDALKGRKKLSMPRGWAALSEKLISSPSVHEQALVLGLIFGDSQAATSLRKMMMDRSVSPEKRQWSVQALVEGGERKLGADLLVLLDDRAMRASAIRALAAFDDPGTPKELLNRYASFSQSERADTIGTLTSRPNYARSLFAGIDAGIIPRRDISPYVARQMQAFGNPEINKELARVWGTLQSTTPQKRELIAKYKSLVTTRQSKPDPSHGRVVFDRTCAQCHRLFGEGNDIGPDLTGSNRDNIDFILENVIDPNAIVGSAYKLNIVATKDGRILSGIVRERSEKTLVLQTANDRVTLAVDDIEQMKESANSMMPEGIFDNMTADEVRDLVAYLAAKSQVQLPK
jgi:putative membrane-bound dehydrogenase-like protein